MKFIELFAGIGGMGFGLMKAGMECVGFVEWDKYAHKAFKLLHDPEERMWARNDITTVSDDDLRLLGEQHRIELVSGGFPCQSFSIAGKRQGFADRTRGTLFFEIIRFAEILKPKYLLLENVKGLLNHDGGRTYATIICALDELGYDCEWQLLNSKSYVPQNRERIFIVGHLRGSGGRKVFPFGGENSKTLRELTKGEADANRVYDGNGIARTLKAEEGGGGAKTGWYTVAVNDRGTLRETENVNCIDANYYKGMDNHGQRTHIIQRNFSKQYSVYENHTGTLQASRIDKVPMLMEPIPCLTPDRLEKRQNGRRFKEPGEPMFTLNTIDRHGVAIKCINPRKEDGSQTYQQDRVYQTDGEMVALSAQLAGRFNILDDTQGFDGVRTYNESPTLRAQRSGLKVTDGYRIRKLTPLECFRLQSYPDEWFYTLKEHGVSDSQLYKMAGNGVTSAVAYEIGKRLMEVQECT